MGLFDYIRCEHPLPDGFAGDVRYQTKDTDAQYLENYKIGYDGCLYHEDVNYEDRSDPHAEGLLRIIGAMTPVPIGWSKVDFHGAINFYMSNISGSCGGGYITDDDLPAWSRDYTALFDHGKLLKIEGGRVADFMADSKQMTREEFHAWGHGMKSMRPGADK